jgi:NADPH:quinone reductase-like Zn-dependent oxidoreductase
VERLPPSVATSVDSAWAIAFTLACDGEMSRGAIDRLNAAIGSKTIPPRTQVYPLKDVVQAHSRIEQGHVVGKNVLSIRE